MSGFIRKPKDFLAGLLFLAIGSGALLQAQDYALGTARRMGPGYFPTLLSGILCALALILILRSLFGARDRLDRFAVKPLVIVTAGIVLFAVLLRPGCQDDVCSPAPPTPYGVRTLFTRLRADGVLATMGRVAAACIICSVLQQPSEAKLPHHRKLS